MLYTGSIFAPPKPGSALRGMYYLAAWGALLFFRMPLENLNEYIIIIQEFGINHKGYSTVKYHLNIEDVRFPSSLP